MHAKIGNIQGEDSTARAIHEESVVVIAHCDSLAPVLRGERRLGERSNLGHVDIPRLLEGGVTAVILACGLHAFGPRSDQPTRLFLQMADVLHQEADSNSKFMLVRSGQDIVHAKELGCVGAILGTEDSEPLDGSLAALRLFYKLGLRNLGLVWGPPNGIGFGVSETDPSNLGLTRFGREVVRAANRLGMMIDVAHINEAGFWEVLDLSDRPIINSHSNAKGICNHPRNLSDEQIRALAEKGGVIGVNFTFLTDSPADLTVDTVLDHIDYIVSLVGPEHVGIGADFDGLSSPPPRGLEDATCIFNITRGLVKRGYDRESVRKILGGNFLRVFSQVADERPYSVSVRNG